MFVNQENFILHSLEIITLEMFKRFKKVRLNYFKDGSKLFIWKLADGKVIQILPMEGKSLD